LREPYIVQHKFEERQSVKSESDQIRKQFLQFSIWKHHDCMIKSNIVKQTKIYLKSPNKEDRQHFILPPKLNFIEVSMGFSSEFSRSTWFHTADKFLFQNKQNSTVYSFELQHFIADSRQQNKWIYIKRENFPENNFKPKIRSKIKLKQIGSDKFYK